MQQRCTVAVDANRVLQGWYWPQANTTQPATDAALLLHGAESHSGWFSEVARHLQRGGVAALAYDRSGWGDSAGARGHLPGASEALAEVSAAVSSLLRFGHSRIHLLGISWGGLLAAYAGLQFKSLFTSVTLVAPALYPKKVPRFLQIAPAILGGGRQLINLDLAPEDFTSEVKRQSFIAQDPLRVTSVSLHFCLTTLWMMRQVRAGLVKERGLSLSVLLAGDDCMVDGQRTSALAKKAGYKCYEIPGKRHALVLEAPEAVAQSVLQNSLREKAPYAS